MSYALTCYHLKLVMQVAAAEDDTLRGTMDDSGDAPVGSAIR